MKKYSLHIFIVLLALLSLSVACTSPTAQVETRDVTAAGDNMSTPAEDRITENQTDKSETNILPDYPLTVTDDLGRKVVITSLPKRIVSLAPSNTEILFALGLEDSIVGVTDYCDYPDAAKSKTRVSGYSTPDLERLVSLEPDLIVAESIHEKTALPALEQLGMTVYVTEALTIDSIKNDISVLGKITGKTGAASRVLDTMNYKINSVVSKTQNLGSEQRLKVLYVNWHDPIWTMGRNNYINDVIEKAGGNNIYADDFEKSRAVSLESVIAKNPQVIFVSGMGTTGDVVYNGITSEVRLYNVDAVLNNRIYKMGDANLIERPGPRIADGLLQVSKMIHPEAFGEYK
ncbi:MAG: cobalamin-binding protein [Dehalococcoidia bacterium]|nr:cobalamin-binding protein [Dehalococcoidia bacterium]